MSRKLSKLAATAARLRAYAEPRWPVWRNSIDRMFPAPWVEKVTAPSSGLCDLTASWLKSIIGGEVRGGYIFPFMIPHAWLQHGDFIIDITADQFGLPPVIVSRRFEGIGDKYIELPPDQLEYETMIRFHREFLRLHAH